MEIYEIIRKKKRDGEKNKTMNNRGDG